ncbi:MAG: hypothetical protein FJ298_01190 [Planctomycetes bacterium]|nr:hypothetical protein [Planctomycetota bacterium]
MQQISVVHAAFGVFVLGSILAASNTGPFAESNTANSSVRDPYRLEASLSPDGRWVAVSGARGWSSDTRCWIVPLETGVPLEIVDAQPNGAQTIAWNAAGEARVEIVNRELGVRELRWIEPATGETVRFTRDRDAIRAELRAATLEWGTVQERVTPDGRTLRNVRWTAQGSRIDLESVGQSRITLSPRAGAGFFSATRGGVTYLTRFDIVEGTQRDIVQSGALDLEWNCSSDGRKLLISEGGLEHRVRIVDARAGTLLDGPWMATEPRWIEGCDGRYFAGVRGGQRVLFDLLRDREVSMGTDEGAWPEVTALSDGRFVVENDREIALFDADFRRVRCLFHAGAETAVARR